MYNRLTLEHRNNVYKLTGRIKDSTHYIDNKQSKIINVYYKCVY